MYSWIKKNFATVVIISITIASVIFLYSCESQTQSILNGSLRITRAELQLELNTVAELAKIRIIDLDRQDAFKAIFLENALVLVQGQPFNPVGLITAIFGVYGIKQTVHKVKKGLKNGGAKQPTNTT